MTKGCIAALYVKHLLEHQTASPFKIVVWPDSGSAKAVVQRLGPGRRAKHWEVQTLWVRQLVKFGLMSLTKVSTLENCADVLTKHVPRAVLDKLAGMMGYTLLGEESATSKNVHEHQSEFFWIRKVAALMKLLVFDDEEIDELENDIHSFVDKTTHLTTAVLRREGEMSRL